MTFDTTTALGAMTGARYIESLKDGREVWLDGEKVQDVTTHLAFTGMVHELARIYDLQHTEPYRAQMTFISTTTGNRYACRGAAAVARDLQKNGATVRSGMSSAGATGTRPRYPGTLYYHPV